jgi:hypothetical protein
MVDDVSHASIVGPNMRTARDGVVAMAVVPRWEYHPIRVVVDDRVAT